VPCFRPLKGYRSKQLTKNGKRSIVFNPKDGFVDMPIDVPCGQCIGCRLERSRQWAIRCLHESSLYDENCFITLTYDDDHLPEDGSLQLEHFQKFMKRLRKRFEPRKIRFFHCGEYGEKFRRPHYHACLFNFDLPDKKLFKISNGFRLYTSDILDDLWSYGYAMVGDVTFESAAYVARYITKKITGEAAKEHYQGLMPEYTTMSRRPGIGAEWFRKYKSDVFPNDMCIINGKQVKVPKFYDGLLKVEAEDESILVKSRREKEVKERISEHWDEYHGRLRTKERVAELTANQLKRSYEKNE
jgi:hypothetical protein